MHTSLCVCMCVCACLCVVKCQRVGSNSLDLITGTLLPKMTIMICQLHWAPLICLSLVTQLDLGCNVWPSHQDHHKSVVGIGPTPGLRALTLPVTPVQGFSSNNPQSPRKGGWAALRRVCVSGISADSGMKDRLATFFQRLCAWQSLVYDICCAISTWITCSLSLSLRHCEEQSCETDSCAFLRGYIIQFTSAYFCCWEPFWKDSSTAAAEEDHVL